jgi:protein O-mannosyl-transferase
MTEPGARRKKWTVCALLGVAVLAVFWTALKCTFVGLDDPDYVVENTNIQHGLNWQTIRWAFTTGHAANWHPLTWLSHTVDWQLYGPNPAGHHSTSVLLHLGSTVLLFLLLNRLTGALWRSAFVAAIFALHPLRVESVVWISERKDALSTFFWMLTVWAYVRYVEEFKVCNLESVRGKSSRFRVFYILALVLYACALMSKAMVVTLPFVLLLLDFWPLGRLQFGSKFSWRLIEEKIPFLLLALGASVTTYLVQTRAGVVAPLSSVPLDDRLANASVAYVRYLAKIFWPSSLAVFYGRAHWNSYQVAGAVLLLALITFCAVWQMRKQPYLAMGWFWFLGILVPVIGLVQQGRQSLADRFTYLPSVGISIMVAWGVGHLAMRRPVWAKTATALAALVIAACAVLTPRQIVFWRSLASLYARAADISDQDYQTCFNIGCTALEQGDFPRAARCFERALKAADKSTPTTLLAQTKNNLGCAFLGQGEVPNAISNFESALVLQPAYPQAFYNMGRAFLTNQQPDVAVDCFQRALALDPSVAEIHCKLAGALVQLGRYTDAIKEYSQALQLRPGMDDAANSLALLLATCSDRSFRDGPRAVALARQASEHTRNPVFLATLAAAYAEDGKPSEAVAAAQQARQLALAQNDHKLADMLESQARQYQAGSGGLHR